MTALPTYTPHVSGSGGNHPSAHEGLKTFVDKFGNDDLLVTNIAFTDAETTSSVAHGLSATPDFIVFSQSGTEGLVTYAADTTSVTFTRAASTSAATVHALIAVIA